MPTRVQLDTIVEAMEMQFDEMHSYLHRPSGRVVTVSDEALQAAEHDDDLGASEEELADARQIISAEDEYLELPDRFEINEYRMMERFARGLDGAERDATLRALAGRGAFRYFKDTVHQLGLAKAWYAFRDECYRDVARSWCEAHDIEYDSSP